MQICEVERGNHEKYSTLFFACSTFIPRTPVIWVCPEGLFWKWLFITLKMFTVQETKHQQWFAFWEFHVHCRVRIRSKIFVILNFYIA